MPSAPWRPRLCDYAIDLCRAMVGEFRELRLDGGHMREPALARALIEAELQRGIADRQQLELLGGRRNRNVEFECFCPGNHATIVANGCHRDIQRLARNRPNLA